VHGRTGPGRAAQKQCWSRCLSSSSNSSTNASTGRSGCGGAAPRAAARCILAVPRPYRAATLIALALEYGHAAIEPARRQRQAVPFRTLRFEQLTRARLGQELTAAAPRVAMRALRDPPSGFQYHGCSSELSGQRDVASSPYLPVDRHSSALANHRMAAAASARLEPSGQAWVSTSAPGLQRSPPCSSIGWRSNVRDRHHEGNWSHAALPGSSAVHPWLA